MKLGQRYKVYELSGGITNDEFTQMKINDPKIRYVYNEATQIVHDRLVNKKYPFYVEVPRDNLYFTDNVRVIKLQRWTDDKNQDAYDLVYDKDWEDSYIQDVIESVLEGTKVTKSSEEFDKMIDMRKDEDSLQI